MGQLYFRRIEPSADYGGTRSRADARTLLKFCARIWARMDYLLGSSAGFTYVIAKGP